MKIAINGFGRIGRYITRALIEHDYPNLELVAVNDLGDRTANAHLLQYDSTHGRLAAPVKLDGEVLTVGKQSIRLLQYKNPQELPWRELGVDIVLERTGRFTQREQAAQHLTAGAKKVIISAPGSVDVDATVVFGVNHQTLTPAQQVISNASCTTNCLAPVAKVLDEQLGIMSGLMNTIHAYTNDQMLLDGHHTDLRRARAAALSMIPTKTGAAQAVGLVLPQLKGRLDGFAVRVPTANVSVVDFTFIAKKTTSADAVNALLIEAAAGPLSQVMVINQLPLVSCDFNHHPASAIVDVAQTKVIDSLVKVVIWYDNEWGFSNRMLDLVNYCSEQGLVA